MLLQITIIKGKVEEVELPVQKVDVIISEVCSPSRQRLPLVSGLRSVQAAAYGEVCRAALLPALAFVQLALSSSRSSYRADRTAEDVVVFLCNLIRAFLTCSG